MNAQLSAEPQNDEVFQERQRVNEHLSSVQAACQLESEERQEAYAAQQAEVRVQGAAAEAALHQLGRRHAQQQQERDAGACDQHSQGHKQRTGPQQQQQQHQQGAQAGSAAAAAAAAAVGSGPWCAKLSAQELEVLPPPAAQVQAILKSEVRQGFGGTSFHGLLKDSFCARSFAKAGIWSQTDLRCSLTTMQC